MSEVTVSTRRIGTRAAVRQEHAAMAESDAPPPDASPSKAAATTSPPPKVDRKTAMTTTLSPKAKSATTPSAKVEAKTATMPSPKAKSAPTPSAKVEAKTATTTPASPKVEHKVAMTALTSPKVEAKGDTTSLSPKVDSIIAVTVPLSPKLEPKEEPEDEPGEEVGGDLKQEPKDTPDAPAPMEIILTPVTFEESVAAASTSVTPGMTAVQMKDSLVLQPLGQSSFSGRKRKANFTNEETETLVKYVVRHFSALYGSEALRTESTRRNQRRSQLWHQIQKHVNDLGYTARSIDDLKHKWRDLRLEVKRKITHRKTGSKVPPAPGVAPIIDTRLNPMEDLVASTIGHHCSLDGEQEGLYIEPGVPRQSIFFNCRGSPGAPMPELSTDKLGTSASPRPNSELSLVSPVISTSPAALSFIVGDDRDSDEYEMDVTSTIPLTDTIATTQPTVKPTAAVTATQPTVTSTLPLTVTQPTVKPTVTLTIGQPPVKPTVTLTIGQPTVTIPITQPTVTPTLSLPVSQPTVTPTITIPIVKPIVSPTITLPIVQSTVAPTVTLAVSLPTFTQTISQPKVTVQSWPTVKELCTLVASQTVLPPIRQTVLGPQILPVKQEAITGQPILVPSRCNSQNSIVSSPEGSVSNMAAPALNGGADNPAPSVVSGDIEMVKLKMEDDEEGGSQDAADCSPMQESQDEWEGQSGSPQPSENAPEDSMPSTSSQDGDPSSSNELPANGGCSCEGEGGKDEVKAKMQRLLELEERWDRMYDRELGIWEEERAQQQQQRAQDRELQQQLLGVLTDIRNELRQLREDRAAARQNQMMTNSPPAAAAHTSATMTVSPKAAASPPETPKGSRAAAKQTPAPSGKRRGRPRLVRSSPEPARPLRPTQHPSPGS